MNKSASPMETYLFSLNGSQHLQVIPLDSYLKLETLVYTLVKTKPSSALLHFTQ